MIAGRSYLTFNLRPSTCPVMIWYTPVYIIQMNVYSVHCHCHISMNRRHASALRSRPSLSLRI